MPNESTQESKEPLVTMGDLHVHVDAGESKETKETAPETTEVKIGEKAYTIPKDVAEALEVAKKAGADVEVFKKQVADLARKMEAAQPKPEPKPEDGYSVLLFSDPDKAVAKLRAEIVEEVRAEVRDNENVRLFWDEFYNQNKDLKEYDEYVKFVYARDRDALVREGATVAVAIGKIAESAKAGLLKLRGGVPVGGKSKPVGEGGSEGNSRKGGGSKDTEGEESEVNTRSILAKRAEARRQASKPGRK